MEDLTGFVLAGGKSSRMGEDKAFLSLNGETLLSIALKHAAQVTGTVKIVGQLERLAEFAEVIPDVFLDCGPLAGIHAALCGSTTELNLILSVDTPFIVPEFLHYLVEQARRTPALATVPRIDGRFQPLCAVYRRAFAQLAERSLAAGHNRIDALFAPEFVRIVGEEEVRRLAFPLTMFDNLNTREDFERARCRTANKS